MEVVLHIGINKTGTSALQAFLHHNPTLLAEHGILYPHTGRGSLPSHYLLAEILNDSPERAFEYGYQLKKEARDYSTVILSSEAFRVYPPEPLAAMLQGIPTRVVVYLRPHMQLLSSWYREGIKSRNFYFTFPQFVEANAAPYFPWLQNWANYFPTSVYVYDRRKFEQNSIVQEFFSKLDLWKSASPFFPETPEENPSISGNLLYLKREINAFISEYQAQALIPEVLELATLSPTFQGAMTIDPDTAHAITRMSEPDVQQIAEAFNIDITDTTDPNHGSPIPNLATLPDDAALLYDYSQARKFEFAELLYRTISRPHLLG